MRFLSLIVGAMLTTAAGAAIDALVAPPAAAATADFVADAAIQKDAEASAADAVKVAKQQFNVKLDGSEASIDEVERMLAGVHSAYSLASPKPPDDQLLPLARALGGYFGEVYRRNHGATWGTVTLNGTAYPGFRTDNGIDVWATGRMMNRITDGPENNVVEYYRRLVAGPPKD